MDLLTREAMHV